jgi:hypothetical protein
VERMAGRVQVGPPDKAHPVTARVGAFLEHRGEALSGARREAFLNLPDPGRMQDSVVEMQFPLQAVG